MDVASIVRYMRTWQTKPSKTPAWHDQQVVRGDWDAGRHLFAGHCAGCHGERGRGGASARLQGIKPPDLTDLDRAASFSGEDRLRIIAEGVEGTTMIGWNSVLTENEIVAVYRHLCALMHDAREGSG